MRNGWRIYVLGAIAVALAGCASIGHDFDISKTSQLSPGVSTEADARQLLGEPLTVEKNPANGHDLLVWQYAYGTGLGTGGGKKLAISFDEKGKMIAIIQKTQL